MVICKNCGAFMRFDPSDQNIKCDHCGSSVSPLAVDLGDESQETELETTVYTCPQCGGDILCDDDTAATFCSYCGAASVVLSKRLEKIRKPEHIIPFKKTKEECFENYKKVLKKALFAPSYMQQDMLMERFRGIYMPYWLYHISHNGNVYTKARHTYRRGDYKHIDIYDVSAFLAAKSDGISFDASSSFSDSLSRGIAPFDTKELQNFSQAYISGFYADMCNVPASVYEDNAVKIADTDISDTISKNPYLKMYEVELDTATGDGAAAEVQEELDYFPVWFLACRTKDGSRLSYAVVNGQTGKVAMDIPIDYKKYILGSLIVSLPIIIILNLFLTLTPKTILLAGVVFALICGIMQNNQMNLIYTRELEFDDEGKAYRQSASGSETEDPGDIGNMEEFTKKARAAGLVRNKNVASGIRRSTLKKREKRDTITIFGVMYLLFYGLMRFRDVLQLIFKDNSDVIGVSVFIFVVVVAVFTLRKHSEDQKPDRFMYMPWEDKLSVLIKPALAILISVIVLIANPIHDHFYYGAAIISMILSILATGDLVRGHNRLALRRPPQFNKRGGDA